MPDKFFKRGSWNEEEQEELVERTGRLSRNEVRNAESV